jgi:hypothetical protein
MSKNAVLKGAGYILAHGPDFVVRNGTTQTMERIVNPQSDYLKELGGRLRNYEEVVAYPPNQVYIGNIMPNGLSEFEFPWYDKSVPEAKRWGKFGEIMPQDEFIGLLKICDVFDLVHLNRDFAAHIKEKLSAHPLIGEERALILEKCQEDEGQIKSIVENHGGEGLYHNNQLVGAVKKAHDIDENLSAHVIVENLVSKASNVLSLLHLLKITDTDPGEID